MVLAVIWAMARVCDIVMICVWDWAKAILWVKTMVSFQPLGKE